jgi:small subunit ribosomal protein S21
MAQVIRGEHEGIEATLRRFKREVSKAEIFPDMKKHRHLKRLFKNASAKPLPDKSSLRGCLATETKDVIN